MKIILDTSIIVEIDRQNENVVNILEETIEKNIEIVISTITISEILTGSYLKKEFEKAVLDAKRILTQFLWIDLDGEVAEKTAQILAYLIAEGKMIEYQDIAIAAIFFVSKSDYLITLNKKHFESIESLKGKVLDPDEFNQLVLSRLNQK